MPLQNINNLQLNAKTACENHFKKLVNAPLEVIPDVHELAWDPVLRRQVFRQTFRVWRDFDKVSATLAENGQVRELKVHSRFESKDSLKDAPPVAHDEALRLSEMTGLLGDTAFVDTVAPRQDGMVDVKLIQVEHALPEELTVTINPRTRQVAGYQITKP